VLRRLISATVLIPLIVLVLMLDYHLGKPDSLARYGIALSLISVFLVSLAASEFVSLWADAAKFQTVPSNKNRFPSNLVVTAAAVVMVLIACCAPAWLVGFDQGISIGFGGREVSLGIPFLFSLIGLLVAFSISVGHEMWNFDSARNQVGEITDRLGRSALIYVYLIMLFGFLIPHRWLEGNNGLGLLSIIALIATIKTCDSFAFFAGKAFGTTKLAPHLSPNKTVQGAAGAIAGSFIAVGIVFFVVAPQVFGIQIDRPWWWFAAYAIAIAIVGILGDLAESMFKRDAARKDSSSWIPGLGGVLDVIDSLVFACPVSYLMWMI
jgi:phosphatidate cytidylyltransferase